MGETRASAALPEKVPSTSSDSKRSAGFVVSPSRSRTVLLYCRLDRRRRGAAGLLGPEFTAVPAAPVPAPEPPGPPTPAPPPSMRPVQPSPARAVAMTAMKIRRLTPHTVPQRRRNLSVQPHELT